MESSASDTTTMRHLPRHLTRQLENSPSSSREFSPVPDEKSTCFPSSTASLSSSLDGSSGRRQWMSRQGYAMTENRFLAWLGRWFRHAYCSEPVAVEEESVDFDDITYPTGWKWFLLLMSAAIPYIVVVLDDTIIATIIPVLLREFREPADIGWQSGAYFLPLTVLMPVFGKVYSLWKVKWVFVSSLGTLLISSIVCATAHSSAMFIGGRAGAGVGAAGIVIGAMRIVGLASPRKQRVVVEAAGGMVMGSCTVAGPILGGVVTDRFNWRVAFWINVPVAVCALVAVLLVFPEEKPRTRLFLLPTAEKARRLDLVGASTLVASLGLFMSVLQLYSQNASMSSAAVAMAVLATCLFAVFVAHEYHVRADLALIPRSLLVHRAVWAPCITLFFLFAAFINFVFFLSIFYQTVMGASPEQSAVNLVPYVIASGVAAMLSAVGVTYARYYNPFFCLGTLCFAIGAGMVYTVDANTSPVSRGFYEALLGAGVGTLMLANVSACHVQLEEKDHSEANGLTFLCSMLGSTMSVSISSALFNESLRRAAADANGTVEPEYLFALLANPTEARALVPPDALKPILAIITHSVQHTFLLGVVCAAATAAFSYLIPWKPLLHVAGPCREADESAGTLTVTAVVGQSGAASGMDLASGPVGEKLPDGSGVSSGVEVLAPRPEDGSRDDEKGGDGSSEDHDTENSVEKGDDGSSEENGAETPVEKEVDVAASEVAGGVVER